MSGGVTSASYLSAVSIMLGAYGFFYGIYRERIEKGLEVGSAAHADEVLEGQIEDVSKAMSAAWPLALVPFVIWLIFLGPVIEELEAAWDVCFSLDHYSAIDVAFFAAANAWLLIAAIVSWQLWRLRKKKPELEETLAQRQAAA